MSDTEKFSVSTNSKVVAYGFPFSLARLGKFSQMYERFSIHKVLIRCVGLGGSAETGQCYYGVISGPKDANITTITNINALRPSNTQHVSHTTQMSVTQDIQLSKWRRSDDDDAFTLYIWCTDVSKVVFEVSYDVTFASPRPF